MDSLLLQKIDQLGEGSLATPLRKILYALEFELRRIPELERRIAALERKMPPLDVRARP